MGGGVESMEGPKTPGVEGILQGDKPSGVVTKGNIVPIGDSPGRGGDKDSPSTQAAADTKPEHGTSHKYGRQGTVE